MPSDIFAFIQAQPQTPTTTQTSNNTSAQTDTTAQPGLFDSLISQYSSAGEENTAAQTAAIIAQDMPEQPASFMAGSALNQTIMAMLAVSDDAETAQPEILMQIPEALPEPEEEEEIIWFENTPEPEKATELEEPEADIVPVSENSQPETKINVTDITGRVKNFLSENPDADIDDVVSFLLSDEEIAECIPEDFSAQDVKAILDENSNTAEVQKPEDANDAEPKGEKIITALTEYLSAPKEAKPTKPEAPALTDDDDEPEDSDDEAISDADTITAGQALTPAMTPEAVTAKDAPESDVNSKAPVNVRDVTAQPRQIRTEQRDTPNTPAEHAATQPQDTAQTFREVLDARAAQHEESGQEDQPKQDMQDAGSQQGHTGGDTRGNTSRSRTDTRRTERTDRAETSRTQEHTASGTTHRTNSFQAFLEGAVTDRRAARSSAVPLNLRETYGFNQAQTLRSGIVNVVRFIRTQGQQKASVIVDPPALGRISVELTSGTSGVEATIKVASEQIRQLIQDQLEQLRMNLSRQGVQVTEFTVDVQQDNSNNQGSQDQGREQRRFDVPAGTDDEEPEEFRIDLEEGLLYWLA